MNDRGRVTVTNFQSMIETVVVQTRYPRVFLNSVLRELSPLSGCSVIWPSGFESGIFDFGRTSVSVYFPMRLNLHFFKGDLVKLGFRLGTMDPFFVETRVVRAETRLLTVELLRPSPSQLKSIEQFLDDAYIASHFAQVPAEHFAPEQTFQHWYHGPFDTNLYVWKDQDVLIRLVLELRRRIFVWDPQGWMIGESRDTLSYPTEDYTYFANFLTFLEPVKLAEDVSPALRFLEKTQAPVWSEFGTMISGRL